MVQVLEIYPEHLIILEQPALLWYIQLARPPVLILEPLDVHGKKSNPPDIEAFEGAFPNDIPRWTGAFYLSQTIMSLAHCSLIGNLNGPRIHSAKLYLDVSLFGLSIDTV